jgi:hypothetical protein
MWHSEIRTARGPAAWQPPLLCILALAPALALLLVLLPAAAAAQPPVPPPRSRTRRVFSFESPSF